MTAFDGSVMMLPTSAIESSSKNRMKEDSEMAKCTRTAMIVAVALLLGAQSAKASAPQDYGYYRTATLAAFNQLPSCNAPNCVANGGQAYTSDYEVAQMVYLLNPPDGEVYTWKVIQPNNTTVTLHRLTYTASNQCYTWDTGSYTCNALAGLIAWTGPLVQCAQAGTWTLQFYDNSTLTFTHQFNLSHNPTGPLGITSPTDNQLIQLTDQNYTATPSSGTGAARFSAGTSGGGLINWTASLHYLSSGNYGGPDPTPLTFSTSSGQEHDYTYQSIGGQVNVTARTTLSDGSTSQDCVTFYVEGPEAGIPDLTITSQLYSLYSGSTPNLMTGIAQHEGTYQQFKSQNLLDQTAQWPHESYDGGSHIGLMMVPMADALAWDWLQNTNDGVNSTVHGFAGAKLPLANTWINWIVAGNSKKSIPVHQNLSAFPLPSVQRENMALVLYGPAASASWTMQYYIPVCPSPGAITVKNNTWTCSGASWYWAVNDPTVDSNVTASKIGPGVTTFGNHAGIAYANNTILFNDTNYQPGVRAQLH